MRSIIMTSILLFSVCAGVSYAQKGSKKSASHQRATQELFQALQLDELFQKTLEESLQQNVQANPSLKPYTDVMREFLNKYMSWDSLEGDMTRLYMETFTESEVRQLTDFYETPLGKKVVAEQLQLTAQGMAIGQSRVQQNVGELEAMIQKRRNELQGE